MEKPINKAEKIINGIANFQQLLSNFALIFIMSIITFDVLGRNMMNKPLKGTYEMTELGAALLVFLALAITHRKDEHITIDFVVDLLPTKVRHIINGIVELIIVAVVLLMSQHIFNNGVRMMERKTTTTDLSITVYPFLFIITITLVVFALMAIIKAISYFRMAVNKE
ncbi:MAG TPA: TRAP transporter small permease [Candidatus Pseudogracilibacillus intestinigallinarum]|uniref:TRAP transporter small permease n=1 Tax=Candidatus Pseudogracilibacillus intestinigallinarum TaxID=2838742 RepID=A0A9D1PMC0_9BACI|nr:TRAP transporter small permease [Candidatus Pseudogracilibacillus intestinigallinarum]